MPLTQLAPPYPIFTDKNGDPLDAGFIYFGEPNLNPETNPIQVYYDRGFTQPVAQPVRTSNGYVMRNGSPALIYADSQFSVTVRNKNSELVIYSPVGYGVTPGIPFATFQNAARDVAALLADTQFTYAAGVPNTIQVTPGDILRTLAEGFAYEVAASGASDEHVTTAGGVKLYVLAGEDGRFNVLAYGITVAGSSANDLLWQKIIDLGVPLLVPSAGFSFYQIPQWQIPLDHPGIFGSAGRGKTRLQRRAGQTGPIFRWKGDGNRVIQFTMRDLWFYGNTSGTGDSGGDFTGFSYCHFENLYFWQFDVDGCYADGTSSLGFLRQFSNNTFVNVRSNNNGRYGFHWDATQKGTPGRIRNENTANTFIGCETAGNALGGIREEESDCHVYIGHTSQGNPLSGPSVLGSDIYTDGVNMRYEGYTEMVASSPIKPNVQFGPNSRNNRIRTRSSYPIWQALLDQGTANNFSIMGEESGGEILENPWLANWITATPVGILLNGTPAFTSIADTGNPNEKSAQITISANFQGLQIVPKPQDNLAGQWVTLLIEWDISGIVDPFELRIRTRGGTTENSAQGQAVAQTQPINAAPGYVLAAYDVRFASSLSGTPNLLMYANSGVVGSNIIKIRSIRVVRGRVSQWIYDRDLKLPPALTTVSSFMSSSTSGLNVHMKRTGLSVYNSTLGKLFFSLGANPTSAWRATDGSGDVTPS